MKLAQTETYYPRYQEPNSTVSAVAFGIQRLSDGQWWDFVAAEFQAANDANSYQAMAESDHGRWIKTTGWAIPDANAVYSIQFQVTNPDGTWYAQGDDIYVNSATEPPTAAAVRAEIDSNSTQLAAIVADTNELQADWHNAGRLDAILDIIAADVVNLDGAAMRGTDSAATAAIWTEARAGVLTDWINGGRLDLILDTIAADTTTDIPATLAGQGLAIASVAADVAAILTDTGTTLDTKINQLLIALVYKMIITEATGNTEQFNAAEVSLGTIAAAFATDGTFTTRKDMVI